MLIVALRAPSLAKFGEVDTVPVSEKYTTHRSYEATTLKKQAKGFLCLLSSTSRHAELTS